MLSVTHGFVTKEGSMGITTYIKKQDWFRALLLHLVEDDGTLKSFLLEYDVRGYEKEVKEAFREIKQKSKIKWGV